eukprot:6189146-Pleurochrysis_carterae.AAC.1
MSLLPTQPRGSCTTTRARLEPLYSIYSENNGQRVPSTLEGRPVVSADFLIAARVTRPGSTQQPVSTERDAIIHQKQNFWIYEQIP